MNKVVIALAVIVAFGAAQDEKIDFSKADLKYLNEQQRKEYLEWRQERFGLMKASGSQSEIKSVVIQGNKIHTIIYNTGAISSPGVTPNVLDLVWKGLGYGYEFGPLVTAKVPNVNSPADSIKIVIDGFGGATGSNADGDFSPDRTLKWGWLPKPGYSAPGQNDVASWGARTSDLRNRPKSWPESWYNPILGIYVYPSFLGGNSTVPDEEVYYVVDDSTDREFINSYTPMPSNPDHGGLGLNLEVRTMQFSNPLAEDIIFLVYTAENDVRSKGYPNMYFGMFGDPHVGGASNYSDDAASFIPARPVGLPSFDALLTVSGKLTSQLSRNIVYTWDPDGKADIPSLSPGYFGYKFLESPNNSTDGIDNDDDGITDESPFNDKGYFIDGINIPVTTGISDVAKYTALFGAPKPRWSGDENGTWVLANDDVGIDGIAGTSDAGEGDGVPSQRFFDDLNQNGSLDAGEPTDTVQHDGWAWAGSEPNFGFRDVNESDQIGLRSFWSLVFGGDNRPKNDELMYDDISSAYDTTALQYLYTTNTDNIGDYIFLYGSGPFEMHPGHRERFSIALLMGDDLRDLLLNSETAQLILQADYRFAQPPSKPNLTVVPGDGKVTLYWDNSSESSIDPLTLENDFEGYKIYRSRDFTFSDVYTVTDGFGSGYVGKPFFDSEAQKSAIWHRPWTDAEKTLYAGGFMPVEYRGRYIKYYMGDPDDATGLRHEFVDSTVTNGVTYYYAVVSFDHGSVSRNLPPTECQAIIKQNVVTQEFSFDVNTAAAVPNGLGSGLESPIKTLENGSTLAHNGGNGTGPIAIKVLNEQALANSSYSISFDTIVVKSVKTLVYNVRREAPVVEHVVGNELNYANLVNTDLVASSVRVFDGPDTLSAAIDPSLLVVDSAGGRFKATQPGVLLKSKSYTVAYQYYPLIASTFLKGEDDNSVFDGIRLYITSDPLTYNSPGSYFTPSTPSGISGTVGNPTLGGPRPAPFDVKVSFTISTADTDANGNYIAPPDSFGTTNPANKTLKAPFTITNATDTTTLQILIKDGTTGGKVGRWDLGEEIVILTPPPYKTGPSSTMMGIVIGKRNSADTVRRTIPANTTFLAKMKKPFNSNDDYTLTTTAVAYDPAKADAKLNDVIVVPNPYVVYSEFENPSYRSDLRGDRAIQFRNLPRECTIRIYTITGELVRTLTKNDNSNSLNWDLLSSESARVGYGLYIYHIETPTGGTKIGRLGIIK